MKKIEQISGVLFAVIFSLFTYWQFNDPDPILWVPIYSTAIYTAVQAYLGKTNKELVLILFILTLAAGTQLWMEMTAWEGFMTDGLAMKTMNQELAREAVGLWISSFSLGLFFVLAKIK